MNHIAMNAHLSESGSDRDRFVGHQPDSWTLKFHGKSRRRIKGPNAAPFQYPYDPARHLIGVVARVMEFDVCGRARRVADVLAIHAANNADRSARGRKSAQNVLT